jgi:putative solute:sodium symporter small subunit
MQDESMAEENNMTERDHPEAIRSLERYWKTNLRIMLILLVIWAVAGLGCGVLIADWLNQFTLPGTGFPMGFWFAHQASIVVFVLLILVYCLMMNRLDKAHHEDVVQQKQETSGQEVTGN